LLALPPADGTTSMTELPILNQLTDFCAGIDQSPCDGCDACGTRCTAGIRILQAEFQAIQRELARLPSDEVDRVLGQEKEAVAAVGFRYTACRFRDVERGRCLVYAARPMICRMFGHVEWLPCPIERVERVVPGAVEVMQAYAAHQRKTYEEWLLEARE
jgi:Fe-S-cluster containining protein